MEKITFGRWVRYLTREWQHEKDYDRAIAFAIRMATFGPDGGKVFVSVPKLATLAGVDERTAQRRRRECIRLGMFRQTGEYHTFPHGSRTEKLELALPPHQSSTTNLSGCSTTNLSPNKSEENRGSKRDTLTGLSGCSGGHHPNPSHRTTVTAADRGKSPDRSTSTLTAADRSRTPGVIDAPLCSHCGRPIRSDHKCHPQPVCWDCGNKHWKEQPCPPSRAA